MIQFLIIYDKLNYTGILIGSYSCSIGGQMHRWHQYWQQFAFLSYETNRFHVAVNLLDSRSQKMSQCGKNISDELSCASLVCHFIVLASFRRHLWSIIEQTHGNMQSICHQEQSKWNCKQSMEVNTRDGFPNADKCCPSRKQLNGARSLSLLSYILTLPHPADRCSSTAV